LLSGQDSNLQVVVSHKTKYLPQLVVNPLFYVYPNSTPPRQEGRICQFFYLTLYHFFYHGNSAKTMQHSEVLTSRNRLYYNNYCATFFSG